MTRAPATFPDEPEPDVTVIEQVTINSASTTSGIAFTIVSEARQ